MSDLTTMIPEVQSVLIGGEEIVIPELKVKQLTQIVKLVAPVLQEFKDPKKPVDVGALVLQYPDEIVQLVALMLGREVDWVMELKADDLITVTTKVIEVNLDFFIQRLFPSVSQALERLLGVASKIKLPGAMPSKT